MSKKTKEKSALGLLLDISKKVTSSLELEKVSKTILNQVKSVLDADYSALFILGKDPGSLILIGARGFKASQAKILKNLDNSKRIKSELLKKSKEGKLPLAMFLIAPLKTDSKVIGFLIVGSHKKNKKRFKDADKRLLNSLANHVSMALLNAVLHKDLKNLFLSTVTSLVTAVDAKDPYTHGHSERVAEYAVAIAKEMKLSKSFFENLRLSGILHDVGKLGITDDILSKSTKLNYKEQAYMQNHPLIGSKIVASVIDTNGILRGIEEHHERFNGKGYPKRLKGKQISLEGRIIAIADAFDTLTTKRPYKKAHSAKEAFHEITKSAGTQFDPRAVKAFRKSFAKYPPKWKA